MSLLGKLKFANFACKAYVQGRPTSGLLIASENLNGSIFQNISKLHVSATLTQVTPYNNPNARMNKNIIDRYLKLPLPDNRILAEYIWIDGTGDNMRGKTRVLDYVPKIPQDLPNWIFDGSSTGQATGPKNSDTNLMPVAIYKDPFRGGNNILVLCDCYNYKNEPIETNHRHACLDAMCQAADFQPWFGIEQEYTFLDLDGRPYGWPENGFPRPQGSYYCAIGADNAYARDIVEAHFRACLHCNLTISGINAEVMPSQWEYQIGPCEGICAADEIWISRYILYRIAEEYGIVVTLDPKPMEGAWNGTGAHCNISTRQMRDENGIEEINKAIEKLRKNHKKHIQVYDPRGGKDNERRLTGRLETSSIHDFSAGIANRGTSIRLTRGTAEAKRGYLEDRRPAANMDPYAVCNALVRTICLDE